MKEEKKVKETKMIYLASTIKCLKKQFKELKVGLQLAGIIYDKEGEDIKKIIVDAYKNLLLVGQSLNFLEINIKEKLKRSVLDGND